MKIRNSRIHDGVIGEEPPRARPVERRMQIDDDARPLILTLRLDDAHQARFDALREAHFPASRNHLRAHVTLFHQLPGDRVAEVFARLRDIAAGERRPVVDVTEVFPLGRGVAFRLRSAAASDIRARLVAEWRPLLSAQDLQGGRLHVTVQNKASPEEARALQARLAGAFAPTSFASPGLDLWRYLGGPWRRLAAIDFTEPAA